MGLSILLGAFGATCCHARLEVFWGAVGAFGTVATALIAWRGFEAWESRHARERNAVTAGDALVVTADLCRLLRKAAKYDLPTDFKDSAAGARTYANLLRLLDGKKELDARFHAAQGRVEAFLRDPVASRALEGLWDHREHMREAFDFADSFPDKNGVDPCDAAVAELEPLMTEAGLVQIQKLSDAITQSLEKHALLT